MPRTKSAPTRPSTLDEWVQDTRHLPVDEAVRQMYDAVSDIDELKELALAPLKAAFTFRRRHQTRDLEQAFDSAVNSAPKVKRRRNGKLREVIEDLEPAGHFLSILDESFYDGKNFMTFREATSADIERSIRYLDKKVTGIQKTISARRRLQRMLASAGVDKLGDIPLEGLQDILVAAKDPPAS